MPRLAAVLLLVLAVAIAACGGSDGEADQAGRTLEDVLAAVDGLEGAEREQALLELVGEEGERLSLYTSMSPSVVEPVVEAFEDAYGLDVALYRASSETVVERLLEEQSADFRGADVVESGGPELALLGSEGALEAYESPARAALGEPATAADWTTDRYNTFVVSWNTDRVSEGQEPRSWDDLADPRWEGEVAIEAADVEWYRQLWTYWVEEEGLEPEAADRRFEAIAANAVVVKGHSAMADLAAGEFSIGVNYLHSTDNAAEDGAPVAWQPAVEPIFPRPNGVAVVRGVRHPAAALLFSDWLLGAGQEVLAERNVDPVDEDVSPSRGVSRVVVDVEGFFAEQDEWQEGYERLLAIAADG